MVFPHLLPHTSSSFAILLLSAVRHQRRSSDWSTESSRQAPLTGKHPTTADLFSSTMETTSLAYVFNSPPPDSDEELYPFSLQDENDHLPLSPGDQALLMGVYPATMSDFDFNATIHEATPPASAHGGSVSPMPNLHDLNISVGSGDVSDRSKMPSLLPPSMLSDPQYQHLHHHHQQYRQQQLLLQQQQQQQVQTATSSVGSPSEYEFDVRSLQAFKKKTGRRAGSSSAGSASGSPMSNPESDLMRDSEEILNAPVKSLTEEEKKLRRRAQVAKSARKHRNRQKVRKPRGADLVSW